MNPEEKIQYWQMHIEKSEEFLGSQKAYCEQAGLNRHNFSYWKQRLKRSEKEAKAVQPSAFVPIQVEECKAHKSTGSLPDPEWLARFVQAYQSEGVSS